MTDKNEYVPYGDEWRTELSNYPKKFLLDLLKSTCLERDKKNGDLEKAEKRLKELEDRNKVLEALLKPDKLETDEN